MKNVISILILLFSLSSLTAQSTSFIFEDTHVPADWQTQQGQLTLTTNHYKEGTQSLCWETVPGESVLTVSTQTFNTDGRCLLMFLRSPEITNDHLVIEFLDASNNIQRTANVQINFKGWRELIRTYAEYSKRNFFALSKVRFTLKPTENKARKLYFDNVNFNNNPVNKNFGYLWVMDKNQFSKDNLSLNQYGNPVDIPVVAPSAKEIEELNVLRERLPRTLSSNLNILTARNVVRSYNIIRNDDKTVKGNVLDCSLDALNLSVVKNILDALQTLAGRINASPSDSVLFINMVDHMFEQGFAEGVSLRISSSSYSDARYIPAAILNLVPYLPDNERKIEMLKLARWLSEYGTVYYPSNQYLKEFNSDLIYNYIPHMYGYAVLQPDDAVAVRELKALKRYLERHAEVVPGNSDMIKIDGTGFHHWTHYNNYMYSYSTWALYVYHLRGTSFNMNAPSYLRFRDAVMATYKMANKKEGNKNHFWANSLSGRNPYVRGGINVQVNADRIEGLIEASKGILGGMDEELAAAYNYFFMSDKYNVAYKDFDGYYQFNYSPSGIARKGNWVVAMRAPTSYFWGAEIYKQQNRFGRYQSHGTLEVVYTGDYARSGIPTTTGSGGWDWNVVPGTTTVHYNSWKEMMPNKNVADRFDQKAAGTNFSGSLAAGNCGVFATDFVQGDSWGSQRFTPTNLKFKKSVFTFDSLFVCLGTDISAVGNYSAEMNTATNLFQEIKSAYFSDLIINGNVLSENTTQNPLSTINNWILTPIGTGYYIPKGNDQLIVKYENQITPKETGEDVDNPTTTAMAAKAYISHGVKPANKSYHFAMIPNTTKTAMQELVASFGDDGGNVYTVESQTNEMHAVSHKQTNMIGYVFFKGVDNIPFGHVKSTTTEHLMTVRNEQEKTRLHFSVCNPNLRPVTNANFGFLATATTTTLTIRGTWKILTATEGVEVTSVNKDETQITLTLEEGMPVYFTLGTLDDTSAKEQTVSDWITIHNTKEGVLLCFTEKEMKGKSIKLFSLNGSVINSFTTTNDSLLIDKQKLKQNIYFLSVSDGSRSKMFKIFV
ncbi:MAG: polysaccharide lyase family 8 super-sandwich domain-containing protein [Paludibacter sp.]|nr:polysaccharide lyase family 8 super-sandwich domain-containing protein [Paludibacter sp.]MDD4198087.1 polysaccharide lyase family 8 super-sandwich domain-containing protein [Paludibacter sp.]MDD4427669.1 polysaccharide lyase family 8 super-sandwich domain-containing protein [Paludibacter sp.]